MHRAELKKLADKILDEAGYTHTGKPLKGKIKPRHFDPDIFEEAHGDEARDAG